MTAYHDVTISIFVTSYLCSWLVHVVIDLSNVDLTKYTAQQKSSMDFNTMSHFEWTWTILFNVINMYGDLEIYIFSCPPDKKLSG